MSGTEFRLRKQISQEQALFKNSLFNTAFFAEQVTPTSKLERLHLTTGISRETLYRCLRGYKPGLPYLKLLARAMKCKVSDLLVEQAPSKRPLSSAQ